MRAVGVIRVSEQGDREDETFRSPEVQRERIESLCQAQGFDLVDCHSEINVSSGAALKARPGLSQAVTAVLTGSAEVIVAAYTDRLWRSVEVRAQVLRLVEGVGGEVWSPEGRVTNGTSGVKFTGTVTTAADEMFRDQIREKTMAAQVRAAESGIPPMRLIPGLRRVGDRIVLSDNAPAVAEAVRMRAEGATLAEVSRHLREHGIPYGTTSTARLLRNPMVAGAWTFGKLSGTVPAIADDATYRRALRTVVPRGRHAKSERLLARLGILRCATCGSRMTADSGSSGEAFYRCGSRECARRVTINAELVEAEAVEAAVGADVDLLMSEAGRARGAAERALEDAEAQRVAWRKIMDATDAGDREHLAKLTAARDAAREALEAVPEIPRRMTAPWEELDLAQRRQVIRDAIESIEVHPGRGTDRVKIRVRGVPAEDGEAVYAFPGRARRVVRG